MIRPATAEDIDALVEIENRCFDTDRLSRRSFRHMITKAHAALLLDEDGGAVRGYVLLLFNAGTSLARMYSIAVDPQYRGRGIGRQLMLAAEQAALAQDCVTLRLEVRVDNASSIALYESMGYRRFGVYDDYYEDHMDALRYEKRLLPSLRPDMARVPYYEQTLEFTCGPAALMMAMGALDPAIELNRRLELRLWRESTTVFMTSGHGGCGPFGLALAAHHRGFEVEVYVNDEGALFVDSVRAEEKKEVIRLVQDDFTEEMAQLGLPLHYRRITVGEMKEEFAHGAIPLVLISSYRIYQEKFPHWVVVTGFDDHFIYVHDSFVDREKGKTVTDCVNMPIPHKDFERMARYGKSGQRAVLIIRKPETTARKRTTRKR
ncbi:ribosomal protein S18-alanine N-acetyltransferase [Sulfurivermis fontis]|uniref:ribosomal protein S18-alanine N-acetyltransferase n=1 Tax=Sulfurivermis fontis TaxID=1972068 RepID=UPI000FD8FC92|nr:ribosomal protein S18-alanine N-acetyltransferase [Sulfurivermis fontis]